jgi:4-hydroxybenzoate polyprenyltransferase
MVKFSHSIFALPFALSGATLAAVESGIDLRRVFWIVVAMVAARNAAMGFNRLADHEIDARNPRTANRELPSGRIGRGAVWAFTILLSALFVLAAFRLNPLCGLLSPVALGVVLGYSYSKRFTWTSHLLLGLALAMAPVGGALAVSGSFPTVAWILGGGVLLWVAGFDIVYACQDIEFDRKEGLFSIPARFGPRRALWAARVLHAGALAALAGVGWLARLHPVYWVGWVSIALLLVWEHRLVRHEDMSRVGLAFFNLNGAISVIYLAAVAGAAWAERVTG